MYGAGTGCTVQVQDVRCRCRMYRAGAGCTVQVQDVRCNCRCRMYGATAGAGCMVPSLQGARYLTPAPSLVDVLESSAVLLTGGRWREGGDCGSWRSGCRTPGCRTAWPSGGSPSRLPGGGGMRSRRSKRCRSRLSRQEKELSVLLVRPGRAQLLYGHEQ